MTEPIRLRDLMAAWVDSIDPEAEIRYRHAVAREAYQRGQEDAYARGYAQACADVKAAQHGIHDILKQQHDTGTNRWRIYCERCRTGFPRTGCKDCDYRTRETFGDPRPGDYTGRSDTDGQVAS